MSCFNRTVDGQRMPHIEPIGLLPEIPELPSDWRQFHRDNVVKLDPEKVENACTFLRGLLVKSIEPDELKGLVASMQANPEWFAAHHMFGMMQVRNELRSHGFGEKDFGIDNLDDYAVGLVERAFGV